MPNESFARGITNEPLLVAPSQVALFEAILNDLVASEQFELTQERMETEGRADDFWSDERMRPYKVANGTLTIPIRGVLLNKYGFQFGRWATGYQYIERAFARGVSDPQVQRIAFDIDSPGGVVAGNFELVEAIKSYDTDKPVYAFANDSAFSAAYNIAAAADKVYVTRSGGVGSIGVVAMHMSVEGMLKREGIKVTYIYAGKHKIDGNMAQDLPDDVRTRFQGRIDRMYDEFVQLVAQNRGMDEQAVRDTEALTYDGQDGVDAGLADAVWSIEQGLAELEAEQPERVVMTTKSNAPAEAQTGQFTQEQMDAAVASAVVEATKTGAAAERSRIVAILTSAEAQDRPQAAEAAALETDMTAEQAVAFLGKLPAEKAEAPAPAPAADGTVTPFDKAMAASGNPNVGAELTVDSDDDEPGARSNAILNSLAAATGKRRKSA